MTSMCEGFSQIGRTGVHFRPDAMASKTSGHPSSGETRRTIRASEVVASMFLVDLSKSTPAKALSPPCGVT